MRKFHLWFAVVVLLVAGVASAAGQQTQTIASIVGRFVVDFPDGQIGEATNVYPLEGADKETMHQMGVEIHNGPASVVEYVVIYEDFPPSYIKGTPQDFLVARRDTFAKGKTMLSDKAINLNGVPGREYTASDDQQNYSVRLFLQGSRLYTLFVVSTKGTTATQASQFLDSFQIQSF
jgi:hypothetical protein